VNYAAVRVTREETTAVSHCALITANLQRVGCRVSRPRSSSSRESRIITRGRDRKLVCGGLRRTQPRSLTHARLSIPRQIGAKSLLYLPHLVKKKKLCFSRRTKSCESTDALQKPRDNQGPRLIKSCKNRSSFMGNCGQ